VWRIAAAAHAALDGEGPRRFGSRWTARGWRVVYASATLSLAALERLVHADLDLQPADLVAISIEVPDDEVIESVQIDTLTPGWREFPAPESLNRIGERWLQALRCAILSVPSAVIPHERNYLLNPAHTGFRRIRIGPPEPFSFDAQLRRNR
jgi:RES domain-containing protein